VDPAVVMRTDHDRFLTGIAQSRLARPERLKGAAFVPFHKPRVTGYVSGKDGSEAAAGRGHGWSEPSAVVVVEYALTLAQLVHHGVRTTSRRVCSRNSWDVRARGRAFVEVRELKAPLSGDRRKDPTVGVSAGAISLRPVAYPDIQEETKIRMIDFSDLIATVGTDPLIAAFGLMVVGWLTTHFLLKDHPFARAIIRVIFLVLLTFVLVSANIVPYQPLQPTSSPFRDAVHGALKVAWWLWAAWFLVGFLRAFVIVEHRPREGKLLQDLLAGLIYLAAALAIIAYVFDLPIQGLLATSGAVAIILGLALQSTLGDVFSGVVLSFSRPYRPGDWISLEGGTDGRVIELNWRATHVLTGRRDLAIVPNSTIAKSKIVNVSSPSGVHGVTITVQLAAKTPPAAGSEILEHAILNCRLILATPSPGVTIKSITAAFTEFEITFFVEELASATRAQNQLFDLIFRHLAVAGIELATPQSEPARVTGGEAAERSKAGPERLLELVAIFASLTKEERKAIAVKLKQKSFDQGETLVKPGATLNSLFIVGSGVLSFTREESEGEIELLRIGPGDHFGEMGMLTGTSAGVKISALMPATVYELAKNDLSPILEARPEVAQELCRTLVRLQAAGQLVASTELAAEMPAHRLTTWFSERLHRLYDLASTE
jgi:small-conductance mechanosensitive channel/CRP-like cAMP-binding protein